MIFYLKPLVATPLLSCGDWWLVSPPDFHLSPNELHGLLAGLFSVFSKIL